MQITLGMKMETIEFNPRAAGREIWDGFHRFRRIRHEESTPGDPLTPDEVVEREMAVPEKHEETLRFLTVDDDGAVVGYARLGHLVPASPEYDSNGHLAWVGGGVIASHRRRGVGKNYLRLLVDKMDDWDTRTASFWTHEKDGHAFFNWLGAEPRQKSVQSRLDLGSLDWDLVDRWVADGKARSPNATIELYEQRLPDHVRVDICGPYTEVCNDMPRDELDAGDEVYTLETLAERDKWFDSINAEHHTVLTREADGEISAITDVMYMPSTPEVVHQWVTGVRRQYRGRGLGKLVKARMLDYIRETYPNVAYIQTDNASSNDAMLGINVKLGFRPHLTEVGYEIDRAALKSFVDSAV